MKDGKATGLLVAYIYIHAWFHSSMLAKAVRVSIKPASSGTAVVKQVNLSYNEGVLVCGDITIISDPFAESKGKTQYNVPDEIKEVTHFKLRSMVFMCVLF